MKLILGFNSISRPKLIKLTVQVKSFNQRIRRSSSTAPMFGKLRKGTKELWERKFNLEMTCRAIHVSGMEPNLPYKSADKRELKEDEVCIGEGTWMEIYQGILTAQLKLVKLFSLGTSFVGVMAQPLLFHKLGSVNLAAFLGLASFVGFFSFVTPFLIHWVSKKYVIKLEYDPYNDLYSATTLSFFLREHKLRFNVKDVVRPEVPGMFSSFNVHGNPLFVDPELFKDIDHYARIMGFNNPVDLRMGQIKINKYDR